MRKWDSSVTRVTELSHFTDIIHYPATYFSLDVTAPPQAMFAQSFEVQVIIRGNPDVQLTSRWRLNSGVAGTSSIQVATERPWFIIGIFSAFGSVSPTAVTDRPPRTSVTGNQFTVTETFTCVRGGTARMNYVALIDQQMWLISYYESTGNTNRHLPDRLWKATAAELWDVECGMPKIVASAAPPLTAYTLSPEISSATHFAWSGANCGSVTGSTTSTMVWDHDEEGCEHAGEAHPDAEISVLVNGKFPVSGESFELRCNYRSAASGEGPTCTSTQ